MAVTEIAEIIARWNSNEGKPYKGRLIDYEAYEADKSNIGCMCAQGQVLHLVGGWTPAELRDTQQPEADAATAKLLNISVTHAILLRQINDSVDGAPSIVLTNPEKVLGDQAKTVLAFWLHLDRMKANDWKKVGAARDAAWASEYACTEIHGAKLMRELGKPFFFLPMFGFADPESIPPLPSDYGVSA